MSPKGAHTGNQQQSSPPQDAVKGEDKLFITEVDGEQLEIFGYRRHLLKTIVTWVFIVLTVGFLRVIFMWRPDWMLKCTKVRCHAMFADSFLLLDKYMQSFVSRVRSVTIVGNIEANVSKNEHTNENTTSLSDEGNVIGNDTKILTKYFCHKKLRYQWIESKQAFERIEWVSERGVNMPCSYYLGVKGLGQLHQDRRRMYYGDNSIIVHVTPVLKLLLTEGLNPFYVFQIFSIGLWLAEPYYYYAGCIALISIVSLTAQIVQQRMTERALKKTVAAYGKCDVFKADNQLIHVGEDATLLVPGDIISIPREGGMLYCDAILLSGTCLVNESMLTGESVPITKTPLTRSAQDPPFDIKEHARHVLFCGTSVIQAKPTDSDCILAVVIRTGFSTAKGDLIRSILYPKPVDFKFARDSYIYVGILCFFALGGMIYSFYLEIMRGSEAGEVVLHSLDLVTIVVPPALPAAMTCGIVFAQSRLKKHRIYCISPRTINVCGGLNAFCFDKTGTLTEDGMNINSVRLVKSNSSSFEEHSVSSEAELNKLAVDSPVIIGMATCHSLAIVKGDIVGDPLEVKMFHFTNWTMREIEGNEPNPLCAPTVVSKNLSHLSTTSRKQLPVHSFDVGIIRQFTFSSQRQRMSVITSCSDGIGSNQLRFDVYAKGAPEMIRTLSLPHTVPRDFDTVLRNYTQNGYRIIALATKELSRRCDPSDVTDTVARIQFMSIEEVEQNLQFIGLLITENRLKRETTGVIKFLKNADIRALMVTGDNMLTALSVARECKLVGRHERVIGVSLSIPEDEDDEAYIPPIEWTELEDTTAATSLASSAMNGFHDGLTAATERLYLDQDEKEDLTSYRFAIDGKSWALMKRHYKDLIPKLVVRGSIFARFSPDQKKQVVEELQRIGYFVGMCGDGANDCGALKTAHAGISLSEAEASVASPFTSKEPNIGCVINLVRQGRAALVTSYGVLKFMAGYSLTQFMGTCILYWLDASFTDFQFLYQDLVLATTLVITFCLNGAYPVLVPKFPKISLLSLSPFLSLFCIILCNTAAMIFISIYTQQQPWYIPPSEDNPNDSYSSTTVFLVSVMHYITMSIVFSKGSPYRLTMFRNYFFLANVVITIICSAETIMYPADFWTDLLALEMPPSLAYRAIILGLSTMHFFVVYFIETYFIDGFVERVVEPKLKMKFFGETRQYKLIDTELRNSTNWPPLSSRPTAHTNVAFITDETESGSNNRGYFGAGEDSVGDELSHETINAKFADVFTTEDSDANLIDDNEYTGSQIASSPTGIDNFHFDSNENGGNEWLGQKTYL